MSGTSCTIRASSAEDEAAATRAGRAHVRRSHAIMHPIRLYVTGRNERERRAVQERSHERAPGADPDRRAAARRRAGFVATLAALIAADPPAVALRCETDISRRRPRPSWQAGDGAASRAHAPRGSANGRAAGQQRDGGSTLDARYETFEADEEVLELQVAYAASALSKCSLENLRDYSDAHNGHRRRSRRSVSFTFGEFEGPVSAGLHRLHFITRAEVIRMSAKNSHSRARRAPRRRRRAPRRHARARRARRRDRRRARTRRVTRRSDRVRARRRRGVRAADAATEVGQED
jgi:hypothetical protein